MAEFENTGGQFYATQDADSKTEIDLENKLLQTSGAIYTLQDTDEVKLTVLGALETANNFLQKYKDEIPNDGALLNDIAQTIAVIRMSDLDREAINVLYQAVREEILGTLGIVLGFRKRKIFKPKWTRKMQANMQIKDSPEVDDILNKKKQNKMRTFCKFVNYTVDKYNRDALILISGDRGQGKTRAMIKMMYEFNKLRGTKLNLKDDIYYTDIAGFEKEVLTKTRLIRGIDEGYFSFYNLDVNSSPVKMISQALTASRNRGHIVIINFVKLTRAVKTLIEISTHWLHKPDIDWAILYIKDREFVGDDAWGVDDLLKAKTLAKKRWYLVHNPHQVTTMRVRKIPDDLFAEYEMYKRAGQEARSNAQQSVTESKEREAFILKQWYVEYQNNQFDMNSMKFYIQQVHHIPSLFADKYVSKFRNYLMQRQIEEGMLAAKAQTE